MASLVTYKDGLRRVDFSLSPNGPRRSIRLGRVNARTANTFKSKIEELVSDKLTRRPHDPELSRWLASLDEKMLSRLRKAGLADGVGVTQVTLGEFLQRVFDAMTAAPSTMTFYGHTRRNLLEFFTPHRLLCDVTPSDADEWRAWLANHEGLAEATVNRRVIAARTFWRHASRWKLAIENPFEGVAGGSQENEQRKVFIDRPTIERVIAAAPDAEWRLLIGLARFGGLRCPSEHLALQWSDIDWARQAIRVRSSKTKRHAGKGARECPIFPELLPLLFAVFEQAEDGATHVITRYRDPTQNLRTQFERIIRRAGHEPWPRLWQNLRASRESELMRTHDLSTVCRWIGNSPEVAAKHYAMSIDRDADFEKATALANDPDGKLREALEKAQQKAQQSSSATPGNGRTPPAA